MNEGHDSAVYKITDPVPLRTAIPAAAQHVLAMFGATVLGPFLMGFDPNVSILMSGISTIFFWAVVRGRVPSYLGSSFAFIAVVSSLTQYSASAGGTNTNLAIGLGAIICAGIAYLLIALIVLAIGEKWISYLMPDVVTGSIVATIGINLAPVAAGQISGSAFDIFIGIFTILIISASAVYIKSGFYKLLPLFIGAIVASVLYYIGANIFLLSKPVDFSVVNGSNLYGLPNLFPVIPQFSVQSALVAAPIALILVAENLGHIRAIAVLENPSRADALDPYIGKAFLADAIATIASGAAGGTGMTTYAENIGVMSITRMYASRIFIVAGGFAIVLGFSPWFGAIIKLIPQPVIGGMSFIIFGLIVAAGLRIFHIGKVDFSKQNNAMVAGTTLVIASAGLAFSIGSVNLGAIGTASAAAIFMHHLLKLREKS